jgi:hypothetical protein
VDLVQKTLFSSVGDWFSYCISVCARNIAIVAAVIATTTLTVTVGATFPAAAKETAPTPERIMVFGDSLSAAYGLNPADGWVALMANALKRRDNPWRA